MDNDQEVLEYDTTINEVAPIKHFVIMMITVFVGEFFAMIVLYYLHIDNYFFESIADSSILSAIVAPVTYLLLTRPLMSSLKILQRRDVELTRYMENIDFTNQAFERQAEHLAILAEELEAERLRVEQISLHDPLTGLPNRVLFFDRLEQSLSQAKRDKTGVAVIYLDLNKFKLVNDTMGHAVGDKLLKEVALQLRSSIRDVDTAARLGGDEFAVVARIVNPMDRSGIIKLAEQIKTALTIPVESEGKVIQAGTSVGISFFPGCDSGAEMVKHADEAMFLGKREGNGRIVMWDDPALAT